MVLGPQFSDDLDALDEPAHALLHRHAEGGKFFRPIAEPDAEQEFAAARDVEKRADLGELDRIVQRQQRDVGAEPEPFRFRRDAREQRELRKIMKARHEMVLAGPDRIEAERADELHLLDRLRESPGGIVAFPMLRVEIDAELHGRGALNVCSTAD